MIRLFRQDGLEFMLNVDLIKDIAADPDTIITLLNGEKIQVKNTLSDVVTKIKAYRIGINEENRNVDDQESNERDKKNRPL
ncbi:MAG: flagellar FlbD family protein [Acidobacteria bacterium]|nr:flagellar FlbD family protein [Acidobacteriota bacterium]MBU4306320.1 flagellar FlbD family protein [Acidobacteriota bacterium]MBU4405605.1 flagellar FlbD family protein [Acidobacteriota bacterium]MCG2810785.1 flagellar FlbD family protein [Candidatus Aminicenantes bacterium]